MPIKIRYASGLHLEFPANKNYVQNNPLKPEGEFLILGGYIVPIALMERHQDFFSYEADNF